VKSRFRSLVEQAASARPRMADCPLISPYCRAQKAEVDETRVVATLMTGNGGSPTMIDVGAHFGTALRPFLDDGWRVLAFEPDATNRAKLLSMLAAHRHRANAKVDVRALSDEPSGSAQFYASDQSTGISGLSAFHKSHRSTGTVEITTLAAVLEEHALDAVDFLKIDTEGFDLKVLRRYRGIRPQGASRVSLATLPAAGDRVRIRGQQDGTLGLHVP
jgi:FkbM family methyltransferase